MRRFLGVLWSLALVVGCNRSDLKVYSKLDELRVLTLIASQPEVAPGATVSLQPLLSDIKAAGRALTYSVWACIDPGIEFGAKPTCDEVPSRIQLIDGLPVTGIAAPTFTGLGPAFSVTVPAVILLGRSPRDRMNGVAYLVFYRVSAADGTSITSFKRIWASEKPTKNKNPGITGITADDAPLTAYPTAVTKLKAALAADANETYDDVLSDGSVEQRSEEPLISWFISDGEVSDDKTRVFRTTDWTPAPEKPSGRAVVVVAVVRDRRGGESFFQIAL